MIPDRWHEYRGYITCIHAHTENGGFYGTLSQEYGLKDYILFEGDTLEEAVEQFHVAVNEYIKETPGKITSAAILYYVLGSDEPKIVTGICHGNCIEWFSCLDLYTTKRDMNREIQGFLTTTGRFVNRDEAWIIANHYGQLTTSREDRVLYSQDVTYAIE